MKPDPRTKLYLLFLSNLLLFFHTGIMVEIAFTSLVLLLYIFSNRRKTGIRLAILYAVLTCVEAFLIPHVSEGILLNLLSMFAVGFRMILPCIITGAYAFSTTSMGEFVAAMRSMHIPESVVIPCAVVIRFFPTLKQDYRMIRDAMALRGITDGKGTLLFHPIRSLEYILMPLLMNASNVAQELSVAALTKGIGLEGRHTCMNPIHMQRYDYVCMFLCTVPFLVKGAGVL